jgi:lipopolysaccharide/colanic/teichoic acid biosynthesis glycosyltransferase
MLLPVMAVVALGILATMGRPILFRQMRPGFRGEPFELIKFRSMGPESDKDGRPVPAKERLSRLGAFLRRTSIDELPELWNIVKGEMSLVGPRPLLMDYLPHYSAEQARRHDVKPGLTGLAQVNGRQTLDWEGRFALDVWYVDNWTLGLDLRILGSTIVEVIRGRGVPPPTDGQYNFGRHRS